MTLKKYYPIILSAVIVFLIKLAFSFLPSFGFDMGTWFGWAHKLAATGPSNFYISPDWTQYTPGYLYYLWLIGKLGWVTELAIKIPVILADTIVGFLIYSIVKKVNNRLAYVSFFLYTLSPVVIFDGPVWGQVDGLLTLFFFVSAYFLVERKNLILATLFWSIAFLIKPQAIAIAPVFLLVIFTQKIKFIEVVKSATIGILFLFIASLPFFPGNPVLGLPELVLKMTNYYSYTSVNAFNIWTWYGMWKSDLVKFIGINLSTWGTIFMVLGDVTALFVFRNKLKSKSNYYLLFAIHCLTFFAFPTRVHERYLFPFFAFLLTSAGLSESLNLYAIFAVTTIASFFNLYYPYSYYYPTQLRSDTLYNLSLALSKIIGFIFFATYFILLWWEKLPKIDLPKFSLEPKKVKLPKINLTKKNAKLIFIVIMSFAFITRVFNLNSPSTMYFDEVYHAFTAKVILSPEAHKAWEWWNTPPAGFAYEWTHPPMAKLGMALGMTIFGQNSFGWRIPGAILGTLSVLMIYLIAKELFADEALSLLSAGVYSLDGLALVTSRIGMNDSYILFFALLSIYLFMKRKDFASALFFGFAIASKWSAIWAIPIFGILWLWRLPAGRQDNPLKAVKTFLWFLILPISIYLLSYFQMFLTGHDLNIWWGMQEQMWWYHTGLKATHPYSSPWWEWPLLIRPIYLYTSDEIGGTVARIYAFGNPLVFWFGFISVISSLIYAFYEKNKKLGLVVFSYLIFFTPWALSPRIMFLYHYLPSIPFMCIATGYVLRRNLKLVFPFFLAALILFIYFYPHWAGIRIPIWLDQSYYWIPSWR